MINTLAENIVNEAEMFRKGAKNYTVYEAYKFRLLAVCENNAELEHYTKKLARVLKV